MPGEAQSPAPTPTCAECGGTIAPPPAAEAEPLTHCEWCGAEYPVPRGDEPPAGTDA